MDMNMKNLRKGWLRGVWAALLCLASAQAALAQLCIGPLCPALSVSASTVRLSGPLNAEVAQAFEQLSRAQALTTLEVDSGGGDVAAGMAIARTVAAQGLAVTVRGHCMSSCANYLFTAARTRHIAPGAVVAWHGTVSHLLYLHRTGQDVLNGQALAYIEHMAAQEQAFFREHGIDGFIAWVGKLAPYAARNFYILSAEDMARFGVAVSSVSPDYLATDLSQWVQGGERAVEPVRLQAAEVERLRSQVCAVVACP
jgi:hypothetical protein